MPKLSDAPVIYDFRLSKFAKRLRSPLEVVAVLDCLPRPGGSKQRFNPDLNLTVYLLEEFTDRTGTKKVDIDFVRKAAEFYGTRFETLQANIVEIVAGIQRGEYGRRPYRNVALDLIPPKWFNNESCYTTTIGFRIQYDAYDITIKLVDLPGAAELTLFPKLVAAKFKSGFSYKGKDFKLKSGDEIARVRVYVPTAIIFLRSYKPNPECCEDVSSRLSDNLVQPLAVPLDDAENRQDQRFLDKIRSWAREQARDQGGNVDRIAARIRRQIFGGPKFEIVPKLPLSSD